MSLNTQPQSLTPWRRLVVATTGLAAVASIIVVALLWPTVTSTVQGLPIGIAGDPAMASQLEGALEEQSPGTFAFVEATDRADAVDLIESRAVYGAIVFGQSPEVLTASAGSAIVAQQLASLAPVLQGKLTAALAAQGIKPPTPIVVAVTDVVPLASTDARGAGLASSSFPLLLGGLLGGIAISLAVVGARRRVAAVVVYSVAAGLSLAGIMQGWFGALQGNYVVNAAAIALALLSMSGVIVGLFSLVGRPGIGIGAILFLLIANPISSFAQPLEFLLRPWGAVGQWFPPGSSATLLRDLSYFPSADATFPWLVLSGWAVAGVLLSLLGHSRGRKTSAISG